MPHDFKFRLQRLLDLRDRATQECKKNMAAALHALLEAQADLHCLQTERQQMNAAWQQALPSGLKPEMAIGFQRCFDKSTTSCELAAKKIEAAKEHESACRMLLDKAMRKQKVLEKLRDRTRTRFNYEASRREQAQLDDFAMLRHSREPKS